MTRLRLSLLLQLAAVLTTILPLPFGVAAASAWTSEETRSVCETLRRQYPAQLVWDPLSPEGAATMLPRAARLYAAASLNYWNAESAGNRAACIFFPSNADQVAAAVIALADPAHASVRFALKSGGHNANLGFSSVQGGLLISFRPNMCRVTLRSPDDADDDDDDNGKGEGGGQWSRPPVVEIEAGCKWEDIYRVLQPVGRTVAGGRLGDVGVTGFLLGGGLSYLSAQHGFGCDNVLDFETVLANGTIVHANATSHPELYFALCGGGNRFGVVTRFTMVTHALGGGDSGSSGSSSNSNSNSNSSGLIWGGVRTYTADKHAAVLRAVSRFTSSAKTDPRVGIIPTFNFAGVLGVQLPFILVTFFYDGADGAPRGVLDDFDAIEALTDDTRTRTLESLTTREVLSGGRYMRGLRFRISVNTFPAMPEEAMTAFLTEHWQLVRDRAANASDALDFNVFSFTVQPVPRALVRASQAAYYRNRNRRRHGGDGDSDDRDINTDTGNALGLDPNHGDRVWIEYDVGWASPGCDTDCARWLDDMRSDAHRLHAAKYAGIYPTKYRSGDLQTISYSPLFMNDASESQAVFASYGERNRARLMAAQSAYDATGFFMTRQGGHMF